MDITGSSRVRTPLALTAVGAALLAGAASAAAATDYSATIASLERDIPTIMAENHAVGVTVALVDGQRVVWRRGFGWADREAGRPVTDRTLFHIGSVSKTFAAAAVMQLVERGLVDLDAPLSRYVPGFRLRVPGAADRITIRSILDHHSGVPGDVFNGGFTQGRPFTGYRAWLRRTLTRMYPERPVDTEWAYNNSGYVMLADLIENVSGLTLEEYAQRHLFRPMGMQTAHFDDSIPTDGEITRNYQAIVGDDGTVTGASVQPREYVNAATAGSIMASARDMSGYLRMLIATGRGTHGRVLEASTLRTMWMPQLRRAIDAQSVVRFGLGWALVDPSLAWTGKVRWHDGGTTWQVTQLKVLPQSGLGVFVSVNTATTGEVNTQVANAILSRAYTAKTGRSAPTTTTLPESAPVTLPARELASHVGRYSGSATLDRVDLSGDGTGLVWRQHAGTAGEVAATFIPSADGWFRSDAAPTTQFRFSRVSGRHLLITRIMGSGRTWTIVRGQKLGSSRITRAWANRLGTYRATNANPYGTPADAAKEIELSRAEGALVLGVPGDPDRQALVVATPSVAFTYGIGGALGRGKGEGVVASATRRGTPVLDYLGVRYVRSSR